MKRNYSRNSSGGFLIGIAMLVSALPAFAQLTKPTPEQLQMQRRGPAAGLPGPTPVSDPRDLNGIWKVNPNFINGSFEGSAFSAPSQESRRNCLPEFAPWSGTEGAPGVIVQTPTLVMILAEEHHKVRKIHLNSEHPKDLKPSYTGDSIGHWEGDTLVVDTTGIKGQIGVGGGRDPISALFTATPTLHLEERFRKVAYVPRAMPGPPGAGGPPSGPPGGASSPSAPPIPRAFGTGLEDVMHYYDTAGGPVPPDQTVTLEWSGGPKIMEWICEDVGQEFWKKDR